MITAHRYHFQPGTAPRGARTARRGPNVYLWDCPRFRTACTEPLQESRAPASTQRCSRGRRPERRGREITSRTRVALAACPCCQQSVREQAGNRVLRASLKQRATAESPPHNCAPNKKESYKWYTCTIPDGRFAAPSARAAVSTMQNRLSFGPILHVSGPPGRIYTDTVCLVALLLYRENNRTTRQQQKVEHREPEEIFFDEDFTQFVEHKTNRSSPPQSRTCNISQRTRVQHFDNPTEPKHRI